MTNKNQRRERAQTVTCDVLLTHGYFLYEDQKEQEVMKPYPPLGLLYLSAYLRREGFSVSIFDTTFSSRSALTERLAASPGGVLGVYVNLITRASVLRIIAEARAHQWTVVLGGPEVANYPQEYLERGADVIVIGEGELSMTQLLQTLPERGVHRLHDVAGLVFRDEDGEIVTNTAREQIKDINSLPWPDREAIDIARYVEVWREHHGMGSVNLITARGCPYTCTWCSHAVFGYSHRRRDPIDCAAEVEAIVTRYGPEQVWYADDVFTISHPWLAKFDAELSRRGLRIPFETISRADRMMKEEVLETLARMGCYRIWIGSESGSQRILDAMKRGVTVDQVRWATHAAQRHGIEVGMFLMWGYAGETLADIEATIEHVKLSNPDIFFTTLSYPIKGTKYFDVVADRLRLNKRWDQATDRDFEVVGRNGGDYYDLATRWLRAEVEAHRIEESDPEGARQRRELAARARRSMVEMGEGRA